MAAETPGSKDPPGPVEGLDTNPYPQPQRDDSLAFGLVDVVETSFGKDADLDQKLAFIRQNTLTVAENLESLGSELGDAAAQLYAVDTLTPLQDFVEQFNAPDPVLQRNQTIPKHPDDPFATPPAQEMVEYERSEFGKAVQHVKDVIANFGF